MSTRQDPALGYKYHPQIDVEGEVYEDVTPVLIIFAALTVVISLAAVLVPTFIGVKIYQTYSRKFKKES